MIVLDGPIGTRLEAMGVSTPAPEWTAAAIRGAPHAIGALHREYAAAGATVHTAATFRTTPRAVANWRALAREAVNLARTAVPAGHRVAGSVAPLEDCWFPERSPADPRPLHRTIATCLADCGVDLLLVETFAHVGEAMVAVEEGVRTGLPVWLALTAGPDASLMTPATMGAAARAAVDRGASAVLVNCTRATLTLPYVAAIAGCGAPIGAYANTGPAADRLADGIPGAAERYAVLAAGWIDAGASIVGACCGTGTEHVRALRDLARAYNAAEP